MARVIGSDRIRKNVTIGNRRTSVSLEAQVWNGLSDICQREDIGIDALCTSVAERRKESSMASALRVFLLTYFQLVVENIEDSLSAAPHGGMAEDRQAPIPGYLETALQRFASEQERYATADDGSFEAHPAH
ncbi:ribbon-helix-helix domain-containing protein [Nisaea acidiphila]|uniref:Ribbon-helix-helix domain-containing protein n=1 Tax=Nisaea acidiphila TaxID=1862145 RepID=A0A9J7AWI5_9PROT|nr:ribbon-helix-helix domain-containing protein [Nisaea acidiphila]UUX51664.1 ribbon-helix-helix domain-containing protein [Nisaea acidiphila]